MIWFHKSQEKQWQIFMYLLTASHGYPQTITSVMSNASAELSVLTALCWEQISKHRYFIYQRTIKLKEEETSNGSLLLKCTKAPRWWFGLPGQMCVWLFSLH